MRVPQPLLVFLAVLALPAGLSAQDDAPPVRLDFNYVSSRVVRGVERAGSSAQAEVEFSREQWRGGFSASLPFDGDQPREADLFAARRWQPAEQVGLEASLRYARFDRVVDVDDSLEAGLLARFSPLAGFIPSLGYFHDFHFEADTVEVAVARSLALARLGTFLEMKFFGGWTDGGDWRPAAPGPHRRDGSGYWGTEMSVPYRIGLHSTVVAGMGYAGNFGRSAAAGPFGRDSTAKSWVTLSVSLDF